MPPAINKYLIEAQSLAGAGRFSDAAALCRKSIQYGKDLAIARKMLADCLYAQATLQATRDGNLAEAEKNFNAALAADPHHVDALNNLGSIHQQGNRLDEAIALYRRALRIAPANVRALENLAKAQQQTGRLGDAAETLRQLAAREPSNAADYLLAEALLVDKIVPDRDYPARIRAAISEKLAVLEAAIETGKATMSAPLRFPSAYFPLSYHGIANRELHERIARIHLRAAPSLNWSAPQVPAWKGPGERIKIGIASGFFRAHSIGNTSRGLVERLDRKNFEAILIRLGASNRDAVAQAMDAAADRVVTVRHDDLAAAREAIAALSLDILFYQDIGMEPLSYLLAFARLAPVQCTSFGHPDTTGIPNLDYFLSSENYELEGAERHYSERLLLLPKAGTLAYYHRPPAPRDLGRAAFGLDAGARIYLCPQTLFKILPVMDGIFKAILERDPAASIVLIDPGQEGLRAALERRLAAALGGLMSRVVFVGALAYLDYLALVRCADVLLDTLHFNGQNTNLEAFHLGVPVVTLPGEMQRERHTYGMYLAMGFMELIAHSIAEYADLAIRVANDTAFRAHCRSRIAESCPVLFENLDFVRACEKTFHAMIDGKLREPV